MVRKVPDYLRVRALRYKSKIAAYNFIQGRLLLMHGLTHLGLFADIEKMNYNDSGKPFLPKVEFNISHSGDTAICAFSSHGQIGVDIEYPSDHHLPHLKQNFTNTEWNSILNSPDPRSQFYHLWCRKEAVIKATSKTLAALNEVVLDSNRPEVIFEGKRWYIQDLDDFNPLFGAICTACPVQSYERILCDLDLI